MSFPPAPRCFTLRPWATASASPRTPTPAAPSTCSSTSSDHFQSNFDRQKGCTYEFDKQTVEGRRQINSTLRLDYGQGKSILDEKNQVTGQTKHVETAIPGCLTDLLTGMFYVCVAAAWSLARAS